MSSHAQNLLALGGFGWTTRFGFITIQDTLLSQFRNSLLRRLQLIPDFVQMALSETELICKLNLNQYMDIYGNGTKDEER